MHILLLALSTIAFASQDSFEAPPAEEVVVDMEQEDPMLPVAQTPDQDVLRELMNFAPNVVRAMVVKADTKSTSAGFMTAYTFAVFETFHGSTAEMFTFWLPGGQRGSIRQRTYGVPLFDEGDNVLLFVRDGGDALYRGMFKLESGQIMSAAGNPVASEAALEMFEHDPAAALANR